MALTEKQVALRAEGIGGSDVAALLGLHPTKQPMHIYLEKTGAAPPDELSEVEAVQWGNILEEPICSAYAERTGRKVVRVNEPMVYPGRPYLRGNIDRRVLKEKRGLEAKNVGWYRARDWGPTGSGEVAAYYLPQVHHYLTVSGWEVWDTAALIGGNELRVYETPADPEWSALIIEAVDRFWTDHVIPRVAPPLDFNMSSTLDLLKLMFPGTTGEIVQLGASEEAWAEVRKAAAAKVSEYQKVVDGATAHLLSVMGEAAVGTLPGGDEVVRSVRKRAGYTVEPCQYVQLSIRKPKAPKGAAKEVNDEQD